jgi:diguanylate cyclase (GGDEF)-like protein
MKKYIYFIVNLFLLIPAIITVYTYAYNYVHKEELLFEEKSRALDEMQQIYSIITNLQQIRGLSNIEETSIEIFDSIEELEEENYKLAKQLHKQSIENVLKRHPKGTVADFESYTYDIEALLLIYKLTAYNAKLTLNSEINEYLLSKSVTTGLPYIVEYFARIRGLASSVSNHKLDPKIKDKIQNQLYMIKELLKNTKEMKFFNENKFVDLLISSQKNEINYVQKELLDKTYITQSGYEIFKTITKNIDFLNNLYYQNMHDLKAYYIDQIDHKEFIQLLIIFTAIGSILVVVLINFFYFKKIQKYIQEVEHLNIIDPMTGLYNRRFLQNYIQTLKEKAADPNEFLTILMVDIDFFKKVNDTYGHNVGDQVIKTTAKVLQENIRKSDLAIRYGGEEFLILLHFANAEAALRVAQKIKDAFAKIEFTTDDNQKFSKTLSIGIAEYPKDTQDIEECIKLADTALYVAKTTGRDKVVVYSKDMSEK